MFPRPAPRPRSWSRSITTRTARSSSRPISPCGPMGPSEFPVTFFHLGRYFQKPVRMHVIENGPGARDHLRQRLFRHAGGFARAPSCPTIRALRASASRSRAAASSTGARTTGWRFSAPPISAPSASFINTASRPAGWRSTWRCSARPEEFPDFTHVYFETPEPGSDTVTVYALLDGPSVAGAYRFVMQRAKAVIMDIDSTVFLRQDVEPPRHRAPDLDVLVLGEVEEHGHRLAAGDPRFRRPRHVDRHAASASGVRSTTRRGS